MNRDKEIAKFAGRPCDEQGYNHRQDLVMGWQDGEHYMIVMNLFCYSEMKRAVCGYETNGRFLLGIDRDPYP